MQDSSSRLREVVGEQTVRLQELRRQLSSGHSLRTKALPELKLQTLQEELRLVLRKQNKSDKQNENESKGQPQTARVEA